MKDLRIQYKVYLDYSPEFQSLLFNLSPETKREYVNSLKLVLEDNTNLLKSVIENSYLIKGLESNLLSKFLSADKEAEVKFEILFKGEQVGKNHFSLFPHLFLHLPEKEKPYLIGIFSIETGLPASHTLPLNKHLLQIKETINNTHTLLKSSFVNSSLSSALIKDILFSKYYIDSFDLSYKVDEKKSLVVQTIKELNKSMNKIEEHQVIYSVYPKLSLPIIEIKPNEYNYFIPSIKYLNNIFLKYPFEEDFSLAGIKEKVIKTVKENLQKIFRENDN